MRRGSISDIPKVAPPSMPLICTDSIVHPLGMGLLVEFDAIQRKDPVRLFGPAFQPAYLTSDSAVGPSNQPFEAALTLICPLQVWCSAMVTCDLLHLNLDVVDVIGRIFGVTGLPFKEA